MADIESNINLNINASEALASIKALQREISTFHTELAKQGAAQASASARMTQDLVSSLNATGKFSAQMKTISTSTESFTQSLEKNKLSMGEYFRYAMASTKTFGNQFKGELETVNKVARERVKDLQTQYIQLGRDANGAMKSIAIRPTTLDLDDFGTKTQIAAQKHQLFNKLLDQGSTNLLNWGKNTQWAGRQLMVGFSVPLAGFAVIAGQSFMKLEQAAVDFKRVYGDAMTPAGEGDAMVKQIKDLASGFTQYGVSVSDTMDVSAKAAAMGATGGKLLEQVAETNKLAVLGGIDQQKSLETITSLTNTFGIATKDLASNIDFLNAVENQTVLNIDDMTTAIPIAAPVVQQLGGDVKDLSVMLTAMKEGGINASEGANALKSGLAALINPTDSATTALGEMGINLDEILNSNRGNAMGMIQSLSAQLDKLDPTTRAQAIEQLFGKFQFARMSTLLENINKQGTQAAKALELTKKSAGELAAISSKELSNIAESPAFKFKKAIADFQAAVAPVGELFVKIATPLINIGTGILTWFNSLSDGVKTFAGYAIGTLGIVAPALLMMIGLFGNGIANLVKMVLRVGNSFYGVKNATKFLGEQTSYLTQEQLHASAVAASLDQVHMQLTQRFTSEGEAVAKLIELYQKATLAQQSMNMTPMNVAAGAGAAGGTRRYNASSAGIRQTISDHVKSQLGEEAGSAAIARAQAAALASEKEMLRLKELGFEITEKQIKATTQLDRSHLIAVSNEQKRLPEAWAKGAWSVQTGGENNMILNSLRASEGNRAVYAEYLKKTGASEAEIAKIQGKINQNIALTEEELVIQGRALRAIGKDWEAGKLSAVSGAPKPSKTFGMYSSVVGAGQLGREAAELEQGKELVAASQITHKQRVAAAKALAAATVNTEAVELDTKAVKAKTAKVNAQSQAIADNIVQTDLDTVEQKGTGGIGSRIKGAYAGKAGKIAGAGMAVSAGVMAASMIPGTVGEVAGAISGPMMALSTLGPLLMELPPPVMAVVVALGALAAVGISMKMAFDSAVDSTIKFNDAIGANTKNIDAMAAAAGNTTASQNADQNRAAQLKAFASQPGQYITSNIDLKFGQDYAQGAAGKDIIDNINAQMAKGNINMANINEQIYQQMATAVVSGAVSTEQAQSIVIALGDKLKDPTMAVAINAKLSALLGPNGQNILESPLQIIVKLSQESQKDFQSTMSGMTMPELNWGNMFSYYGDLGKAAATITSMGSNQLQQQQQILDSLDQEYKKKLDIAKASGDQTAIDKVNSDYQKAKTDALANQKKTIEAATAEYNKQQEIITGKGYNSDQRNAAKDKLGALGQGMDAQIKSRYAGTGKEATAQTAQDKIVAASGLNQQQEFEMKLHLSTGNVQPETFIKLMDTFGSNSDVLTKTLTLMSNVGEGQGSAIIGMMQQFTNEDGTPKKDIQTKFLATFDGKTSDQAQKLMDSYTQLMQVAGQGGVEVLLQTKGAEGLQQIQSDLDKLNAQFPDGVAEFSVVNKYFHETYGFDLAQQAQDYYNSLPESYQKTYRQAYLQIHETIDANTNEGRARLTEWANSQGGGIAKYTKASSGFLGALGLKTIDYGAIGNDMADQQARKNVEVQQQAAADNANRNTNTNNQKSGSGAAPTTTTTTKEPTSWIDDVVKKLRDVRSATTSMTENFTDSWSTINGMFGSGASIDVFGGLQQQMRQLGAGEDIISRITGMSKEEYEKYKDQLFNFDASGNISSFKAMLTTISAAMRAAQLGDFQNKQKATVQTTLDQLAAVRKLVSAGMSYAEAYNLVSDAATASAIANENNAKSISAVADAARQAAAATRGLANAQALSADTTKYEEQKKIYEFLKKNAPGLTDAETSAVLASQNMQNSILDMLSGNIAFDAEGLKKALQDAVAQSSLDLNISKLTISGMSNIFSDGMSKAAEEFSAKKTAIDIQLKVDTNAWNDALLAGKQKIEDLTNAPGGLDDLQANLDQIADKEIDINKKYDDRYKALDRIQAANQAIAAQQRSQLSIADALSVGDIGAAAKAAEEARAAAAEQQMTDTRKLIQEQQAIELAKLTGEQGLTRAQTEEKIRAIKREILTIEEQITEPAQYQIDLATRKAELEKKNLEIIVNGKKYTEDAFAAMQNQMDLAKTSSQQYYDSIKNAVDVVYDLQAAWAAVGREASGANAVIDTETAAHTTTTTTTPAPTQAPTPAPTSAPAADRTYTIVSGDTLWAVARRYYGDGSQYMRIFNASNFRSGNPNLIYPGEVAHVPYANGGMVRPYALGGMIKPMGSDTVPAMLTPGEFVVKKFAVDQFGANNLNAINSGTYDSSSVYNSTYSINVNVKSDSNPDQIARTVVDQIRNIDAQRIRGNRL